MWHTNFKSVLILRDLAHTLLDQLFIKNYNDWKKIKINWYSLIKSGISAIIFNVLFQNEKRTIDDRKLALQ